MRPGKGNWKTQLEADILSGKIPAHDPDRNRALRLPAPENIVRSAQAVGEAGREMAEAAVREAAKFQANLRAEWGRERPGSAAQGITARSSSHIPGVMNKTEEAYSQILDAKKAAGEITDWLFEELRLKVGVDSWYTPDFYIKLPDGRIYLIEVKAFRDDKKTGEEIRIINEDAKEKVKACLLRHPYAILWAFGRKKTKAEGGGYEFREDWAGGIAPL